MYYRGNNTVKNAANVNVNDVIPVVIARDPYFWMQSMCRQNYQAEWDHSDSSCPNIVPTPGDIKAHPRYKDREYMPVWVVYHRKNPTRRVGHTSLVHFYNTWYKEYLEYFMDPDEEINANYEHAKEFLREEQHDDNTGSSTGNGNTMMPRIIIRMEDLMFHGEHVIGQLCDCIGGTSKRGENFVHMASSVKAAHAGTAGTGLLQAIINYGNITKRRDKFAINQLQAANDLLDKQLMELFGYTYETI